MVTRCEAGKTLQTRIEGSSRVSVQTIEVKSIDVLSRELSQVVAIVGPDRHGG